MYDENTHGKKRCKNQIFSFNVLGNNCHHLLRRSLIKSIADTGLGSIPEITL